MSERNKIVSAAQSSYDDYYSSGQYDSRFNDKVAEPIFKHIMQQALESVKGKKEITILDVGAGNGRYFILADALGKMGYKVNLIAEEPNLAGLRSYDQRLRKIGFKGDVNFIEEDLYKVSQYEGYSAGKLQKDNVSVEFVHINPAQDKKDDIKKLVGDVDYSISMLGPISAIPGKQNRVDAIAMMGEVTSGKVVISVGTKQFLKKNPMLFGYNKQWNIKKMDKEKGYDKGDILYTSGTTEKFFHLFTEEDVKSHFKEAGYNSDPKIEIFNILPQTHLNHMSGFRNKMDNIFARACNALGMKDYGRYFVVTADGLRKEQEKATENPYFKEGLGDSLIKKGNGGKESNLSI